MQTIQDSNGERLACGKHLLASGWCSPLVELQHDPPNRRSELHVQPGPGHGRNILHFSRFLGLSGLEHGLIERGAHQLWSAAPERVPTPICLLKQSTRPASKKHAAGIPTEFLMQQWKWA